MERGAREPASDAVLDYSQYAGTDIHERGPGSAASRASGWIAVGEKLCFAGREVTCLEGQFWNRD